MVGLPARGKSYLVKMITRYLQWTGFPCKAFNAGSIRRNAGMAGVDASFFKTDDSEKARMRESIASECLEEAMSWLTAQSEVCIAIFDATNTTLKRRRLIQERCQVVGGVSPIFVESICTDPAVLEQNYSLKLGNDDYKNMDPQQARDDFMERVRMYEQRYETLSDEENAGDISYIKLFNIGQKVVMRNCDGYVPSHIGFYLSNCHISPRRIWLTRVAESDAQVRGELGSVSGNLTPRGLRYCRELAAYVHRSSCGLQQTVGRGSEVLVLIGTAPVHKSTFDAVAGYDRNGVKEASAELSGGDEDVLGAREYRAMSTSLLNELDGGDCNGMSYEQIQATYPDLWEQRELDKLNFRYPGSGGESYVDVVSRLRPVIIELERQRRSVLVISHLAVQRCIFAYFTGCEMDRMPYLDMDIHTVYELNPGPWGTKVETRRLDQDQLD